MEKYCLTFWLPTCGYFISTTFLYTRHLLVSSLRDIYATHQCFFFNVRNEKYHVNFADVAVQVLIFFPETHLGATYSLLYTNLVTQPCIRS